MPATSEYDAFAVQPLMLYVCSMVIYLSMAEENDNAFLGNGV